MTDLVSIKKSFLVFIKNFYKLDNTTDEESFFTYDYNTHQKRKIFGDFSTNAPLILSKRRKVSPDIIGNEIITSFNNHYIEKIKYAGNGFLNIFLKDEFFKKNITYYLQNRNLLISPYDLLENEKYNIEFVSANPTGPLHIGHGRGGIIGDVFSRLLKKKGILVEKEFYINDAGNQITILGKSLQARCYQYYGDQKELPEEGYHGKYLSDIAENLCKTKEKEAIYSYDSSFFSDYAKEKITIEIKQTLLSYGIIYDQWFSEKTLHEQKISQVVKKLIDKGYVYEEKIDGISVLWFDSIRFGDEKNRVIKKSDGQWTYVAADIAYLENKIERGYTKIVMILGQDHHSYVVRLKGIITALGYSPDMLTIILYQLVTVKEEGELLRLSKREGRIIELKEVIETIGKDCARFFYLNKKADSHLTIDINTALEHNEKNPVYYIQYAYVRINSILNKYKEEEKKKTIALKNEEYYYDDNEKIIIRKIMELDSLLNQICQNFQVHLIAHYLYDLACLFHTFYSHNPCICLDNKEQTEARINLLQLTKATFEEVAALLDISLPEKM